MTTSETAKAIREELKNQLGLNRKSVSVRKNRGSAVYVEILDPEVCIEKVEEIANNYESYQRCEATQEILQGGNTFVFVRYSSEAQKIVDAYNENTPLDEVDFYEETEEIKEEIEAKINKAKENNHENREIVILIHKKTKASKATKIRYTYNQDCYTLGEREIWIGKEVYLVAAIVPVKEETEEQTTTEENQTEEMQEETRTENLPTGEKVIIKATGQEAYIKETTQDTFDRSKKMYVLIDANRNHIWSQNTYRHHTEDEIDFVSSSEAIEDNETTSEIQILIELYKAQIKQIEIDIKSNKTVLENIPYQQKQIIQDTHNINNALELQKATLQNVVQDLENL